MSSRDVLKGSVVLILGRVVGMAGGFLLFLVLTWRSKEDAGVFRIALTYLSLLDFLPLLGLSDMLMITADHGCDPDPRWPTTDHSREYVPILAYSPGSGAGVNLGVRDTLADMGQTIAENFGGKIPHGKSFLREIGGQFAESAR